MAVTETRAKGDRLQWPARPKRDDTLVARRRVWTTRCKRYRVIHSHILYGEGSLPDVYYAQRFDVHAARWDNLDGAAGRHRTKQAAMRHCEQDASETDPKPNHHAKARRR